jgi:SRSO17 transposase
VPGETTFTTKPKLGAAMLERALDAGVPCAWVTGDSVYGADHALRRRIEARGGLGYVLAVTSGQRLGGRRVDAWAAGVPPEGWHRLSAGEGSKGPRLYDWAYLPCRGGAPAGRTKGLLVRRKLDEPDELAFYLTLAPEGTDLATLVRVAGTRWTIEACFEAAKGEVGLDQYEVRSWTGWHRHVTLAMLAHAYLAAVRATAAGGRGGARPGRRAAAADRAGGAPAALAPGLGASARPRRRLGLVALAPPPPAARPPLPLATPDRLS